MPAPMTQIRLPIDDVLGDVAAALAGTGMAVLVAPPGAGKTTRVPLALLAAPWLNSQKILVLEPRRLAARGAAERMALTLGEAVGETIGLRARMVSKSGPKTRIEVITEGVFTRMILDDPALGGIGAVLFDEFHERSLDADLGLALALDARAGLREDLRLLVMSATLDGARVASLLGGAPVIASEGRAFPITTRYLGRDPRGYLDTQMTDAILTALAAETGSILAFLPGQGEIRRVEQTLARRIGDGTIEIATLYGGLPFAAQDRAVQPVPPGRRKVVLATAIAETSLTIEGVRIVVDCGLARVPRYEPDVGVTRLETVRVSRASADQRRGRAGRTEPGVCYRLWDEPQTQALAAFADPEIRAADLAGLLLDCAAWGVTDPLVLTWLDPPPVAALAVARSELTSLGCLDTSGQITALGRRLRALPLPPRLASMVLRAAELGASEPAAELAALLVERGLGGTDVDLATRLTQFHRERGERADNMRRLARGWADSARQSAGRRPRDGTMTAAELLALAFPDRIAKARGAPGHFLLANGRAAKLEPTDALARQEYLVIAELTGTAAATRIMLAAALDPVALLALAGDRINDAVELTFDSAAAAVRARKIRRLDAIVLATEPRTVVPSEATSRALAEGIAALGLDRLPWTKAQLQLRDRVAFLRAGDPSWPDLSSGALVLTAADWLAPFLTGKTRLSEIGADDLGLALDLLLPWTLKQRLEAEAPTHYEAPTGNRYAIDYVVDSTGAGTPALHIRVQELFGLTRHPSIAGGRLPLTLHLLSPAHRPIQITRDLPGFWRGSWAAVKSDMKGRYPRHPWPDDPAAATPTARAKPRGT
jgi:ATP-dependent helicase HrpB